MEIRVKDKRGGRFIVDDVVLNGYGKALGPYGIAFYVILCRHANMQTQECWPSQETISKKTGMSKRQVNREADKCEMLGLVKRKTVEGKFTIYTLLEPKRKHFKEEKDTHDTQTPLPHSHRPMPHETQTHATLSYKGTKEGTKEGTNVVIHRKRKYGSLKSVQELDMIEIAEKYKVRLGFVKLQFEKMTNWCEAKGHIYKNYKSALRNFVLRDIQQSIERSQNDKYRPVDATNIK